MSAAPNNMQKRRLAILKMLLGSRRIIQAAAKAGGIPYEATNCAMAVRMGQYQGRPLDASGVARITGLPYATADRHLRMLRKLGVVRSVKIGRRVVQFLPLTPEAPAVEEAFGELEELIFRAGLELDLLR